MERHIPNRKTIAEQLLKDKATFKVHCKHPYASHTRLVEPMRDPVTKWYKGVDRITEKMKQSGLPYVDPTDENNPLSSVELVHNKEFDLKNEVDYLICKWLFECENVISMSQEESRSSKEASFYVYNDVIETQREIETFKIIDEAVGILNGLSFEALQTVSRLMGKLWSNKSPEAIRLDLRKLIAVSVTEAQNFISKVNDKEKDIKIFILRAKDRAVINENSKGEWYFGEVFLGNSLPSVIAWFYDIENKDIANEIGSLVGDVVPSRVQVPKAKK